MTNKNILSLDEINRMLQFQIDDFPDLHQSAKNESLIIFLGAGVSKLYGCSLWDEMALMLAKELRKSRLISFAEQDILLKEAITNPRKVISICYRRCIDENSLQTYVKAIGDSVEIRDWPEAKEIYKKIFSIKAMAHLTTNIDLGIKKYIYSTQDVSRHIKIYNCTSPSDRERIKQINYNIFKDGNIIYLHGNCENICESILPIEKYLSHYSEENEFLNNLFQNIKGGSTIVFLGYGLNEWDIIERIYKIRKFTNERVAFLLSPIFSHEITRFKLEMDYYKSFGVEPVPYIIDEEGYGKVNLVLNNLARAIDRSLPSPYEMFSEIEKV
jgi:hypothetical protein